MRTKLPLSVLEPLRYAWQDERSFVPGGLRLAAPPMERLGLQGRRRLMSARRELVVVLGHENSDDGSLSLDALSRANKAVEYIQSIASSTTVLVVVTGGFGEHFNKSNVPHGKLLTQKIADSEIGDVEFLDHVHSCGTLEDGLGILRILRRDYQDLRKITVVTSAYHRPRVEFILGRLLPFAEVNYIDDRNNGTQTQRAHEEDSLSLLKKTMPNLGDIDPDTPDSTNRLSDEIRHYDNLSYFAVAASFSAAFLWTTNTPPDIPMTARIFSACLALSASILFYLIYLRLAGTASSARRTLAAVSFLLGRPHLGSSKNTASKYSPRITLAVALALLATWLIAATPVFMTQ